jgi:protein-tyrosine phosphatase
MRIDFHSHILPKIDDGASSLAESEEMLEIYKDNDVDIIVATPHLYYPDYDTVESLELKREMSYNQLYSSMEAKNLPMPKIIKGSEVYFENLPEPSELLPLCINAEENQKEKYLLLELPYYRSIDDDFLDELEKFIINAPFKIIFAHIERYFRFSDWDMVYTVMSMGHYSQVNCDSVLSEFSRKTALELIEKGKVQLLGTDAHNISNRPPRFKKAEMLIRNKLGNSVFEKMTETAKEILGITE